MMEDGKYIKPSKKNNYGYKSTPWITAGLALITTLMLYPLVWILTPYSKKKNKKSLFEFKINF